MKTRFIYAALSLTLALSSCSGFLDEEPLSNVTDKNYYATESDAEGAVNAIYETVGIGSVSQWQGTGNANTPYGGVFYNDFWLTQDLFSDNAEHDNWLYANFDNFSLPETDGKVKSLWYTFYRSINTANIAIDKIPAINMDEKRRNHLVGEARFWRGLLYAEMAKIWSDVPLRLKPSESVDALFGVERTDQLEVLKTAIEDLTYAKDNLMDDYRAGYGRANSLMAQAVLAKAYLIKAARTHSKEDYQAVVDWAYKVIISGKYDLYPDFQDNFIISKKHGIESVVSINYGAPDLWKSQFNVSLLPAEIRQYSPGGNEGPSNANSWIVPTEELYNSFAEGDVRRDVTIMKDFTYSDGSTLVFAESARYPYYFCKYWDREAEPMGQNSEQNYPYMRYSEVLLMYAEALNEVNDGPTTEAYEAINKVRDRAFKDNGSGEHDLKNLDYKEFRKAILDERRWELVLEGSRWFDLVRLSTDFAAEIKRTKPDSYVEEKHKLYPIPQYERLLNDRITQNDGY